MLTLTTLEKTCDACPSQWDGRDCRDRPVYIRYRWGRLSVRVGPVGGDTWSAVGGEEVFSRQVGDDFCGYIGWHEVMAVTGIRFSLDTGATPRRESAAERAREMLRRIAEADDAGELRKLDDPKALAPEVRQEMGTLGGQVGFAPPELWDALGHAARLRMMRDALEAGADRFGTVPPDEVSGLAEAAFCLLLRYGAEAGLWPWSWSDESYGP